MTLNCDASATNETFFGVVVLDFIHYLSPPPNEDFK